MSTSTIGRKESHRDSPSDPNYARIHHRGMTWTSFVRACIIRHSSFCRDLPEDQVFRKREGRNEVVRQSGGRCRERSWGNGNQRRRQTWAIIGRYVLLLITIMMAKPGRGYRVRSHGWSACRVYKRCIHLIGIHAASKFLASTCYPGLSLFLPVPSSFRPLAFHPCIYLSLPHRRSLSLRFSLLPVRLAPSICSCARVCAPTCVRTENFWTERRF